MSGGLAQRLQIARAIAHRPKVLFLDEPSAGLDPQSRIAMWDAVRGLRAQGITVVLTTHYMEEADELCDRVAIIDHGRILVGGTPAELKASVGAEKVIDLKVAGDAEGLAVRLRSLPEVTSVEVREGGVRVFARAADGLVQTVLAAASGTHVLDVSTAETSLETVFIKLTGRELRE